MRTTNKRINKNTSNRKLQIFGSVAMMVLLIFVIGCSGINQNVSNPQLDDIQIGYRTHQLYLPLFVGIEKGFFEEEGLDVESIRFESTNTLMNTLVAGDIDAALGGVNTFILLNIESKSPNQFKIFTMLHENEDEPTTYVIVPKGSSIRDIGDLKGKKIGIWQGSTARLLFKKVVGSYFDPNDAQLVQMDPDKEIAALEAGQVDAIIVLEPLGSIAKSKSIGTQIDKALFSRYIVDNVPQSTSIVSTQFMEENPDATKGLVKATNKAIDYINKNPEETKKILTKFTPLKDEKVLDNIVLGKHTTIYELDKSKLQALADQLAEDGELSSSLNVRDMFLSLSLSSN